MTLRLEPRQSGENRSEISLESREKVAELLGCSLKARGENIKQTHIDAAIEGEPTPIYHPAKTCGTRRRVRVAPYVFAT